MSGPGLLVGTFPPRRCGIASYNAQMVSSEGWAVFDASPEAPVSRRLGAFLRAARGHEVVRVSFDPYALACGSIQALWTYAVLLQLGAARFEIVVHEPWKGRAYGLGLANRLYRLFCRRATWLLHVPSQEGRLEREFGFPLRTRMLPHGGHFVRAWAGDLPTARAELGLGDGELWLCIGFVAAAKGFAPFARAFASLRRPNATAVVVGSVRTPLPADLAESQALGAAAASSDGRIEFRDEFVDDVSFDRWIAAADVVVLPYLETSTSGVVERARLFGKVVLARDLPGLRDVLEHDPRGVLYRDEDLPAAVERAASLARGEAA
jgi:glycosyltransferase involved in cell wall biosynthesis